MNARFATYLFPLTLLLCALAGCGDDDKSFDATLDELWPDEDGRSWVYEVLVTTSEEPQDILEDPTDPLPPIREIYTLFQDFAHAGETDVETDVLTTAFDGEVTTDSGVTGRNLTSGYAGSIKSAADPLLALLHRHRPDLRDRLPSTAKLDDAHNPYGITGYCWEMSDTQIRGYGDIGTDPSWIYVDTPLKAGALFELQLVPTIAPDIWLYGLVVRQLSWTQGEETYPRAVEVFTVVDMGVQTITDEHGVVLGERHPFLCYNTVFAPGVGPVYTHEWRMLVSDGLLHEPQPGTIEIEAVLTDHLVPE